MRGFADGRVYTAQEAEALGLVDRIGYLEDALALARESAGITRAKIVAYHRPRQYRATVYSSAEPPAPTAVAGIGDLARLVVSGPKLLYLWWP